MVKDRVTREDLRSMVPGETRTFRLPNAEACDSAKTQAYILQNQLGCKFSARTDYESCTLTLTRSHDTDKAEG